ncbi:MAG TPA: carboxylating nicotinate-nucleotide diphosphorylase [Microthrixaceae bacterium]|nr:carboxylating nicotinate-nucleotide diphosphorylase [Microthrixaceae bacterium]HNO45364.1 carboxylating nicotinate-nucleotide diphosphorylase [Microthrixaceae bacterium]HPG13375.1 carboxylating nicotinate-nucleotide diphosphorylase [Microthrixaceae bacterium]HRW40236.1 carboxylating nicotinate-nucleotide diphosphorylase [Microthrixaceae bacterium]
MSSQVDPGYLQPPTLDVVDAVRRALDEDLTPLGDLTATLVPPVLGEARFVARTDGVLAGTACATETFAQLDAAVEVDWVRDDGARLSAGEVFGVVRGPFRSILTGERTALNFLGFLSGIATLTAAYVDAAAAGGDARVWDTRKTIPGLRSLSKAAVRAGGGRNHRGNLSDWMLIKDNHLGGVGIAEAVAVARDRWPGRTVHVECDSLDQCVEALDVGADSILLDNMSPAEVRACVAAAQVRQGGAVRRTLLEVSGDVTLDTIGEYAATGVDMISVGRITKSAPTLDLGLDLA